MTPDHSSLSLRDRLRGWASRLTQNGNPNENAKITSTSTEQRNPKSPKPNETTSPSTSNEWAWENRRPDSANNAESAGANFLERWLGQNPIGGPAQSWRPFASPEWQTKQNEIGRTRQGLREVDASLNDLNRRIQNLESITEKWQVHSPEAAQQARPRFDSQV